MIAKPTTVHEGQWGNPWNINKKVITKACSCLLPSTPSLPEADINSKSVNIVPRMWADHKVYTLEKEGVNWLRTGRSEAQCKPCPWTSRRRFSGSQHRPSRSLVFVCLPQHGSVTGVSLEFCLYGEEWIFKVHFPMLTFMVTIRYLRKHHSLPKL